MLTCEGVDLYQLRWSYTTIVNATKSENHILKQFLPDSNYPTSEAFNFPDNALKFLSVQLIDVTLSQSSGIIASFSSTLFVNLLELKKQNVTEIECGDVATNEEKLVSEITNEIIQPQPKVSVTYQQGMLIDIHIQWSNLVRK